MIWHNAASEQVVRELNTSSYNGLSPQEAALRLRKYGKNLLRDQKRRSFGQILWEQMKSKTLLVLLLAAVIWFISGWLLPAESQDPAQAFQGRLGAVFIVAACLVGIFIGAVKERCAENALDSLRARSQPSATVVRGGQTLVIPAANLVPGDLLQLRVGDYIPADARLIRSDLLRCDESSLTGEPVSVQKNAEDLLPDIVPLEQRANMVYTGCSVTDGAAAAVVTATGMATEKAKIAAVVEDTLQITTPFRESWQWVAKNVAMGGIAVALLLFLLGMLLTSGSLFQRFTAVFMPCVALAAASIPGAMAATITVASAVGVSRMVRRKMVVHAMPTVETLSRVSVICTDKTGTLTNNTMTMTRVFDGQTTHSLQADTVLSPALQNLLLMGTMCCDADAAQENGEIRLSGDHTEAGIVAAVLRYVQIDKYTVDSMYPRLCELPFDADRKLKTSVNMIDGRPVAVVKGAPDILADRCVDCDQNAIREAAGAMAGDALRVIGIAFKPLDEAPANPTEEELEYGLTFGGLVGLEDPPAPESEAAIATARRAGVRVVMMTGDHASTAASAARAMGIMQADSDLITNDALDELSDEELDGRIGQIAVYVRLTPENKVRVIEAMKNKGFVVAATGDRVADAAVLRAADVGCAMGESGTDVARGAADVTVTDDRFSTMIDGIGAARGICQSIRQSARYLCGCIFGLSLTMLAGLLIWQRLPFSAPQIIWQNLLLNALPVLALSLERPAPGLMTRPPQTGGGMFDRTSWPATVAQGVLLAAVSLFAYAAGSAVDSQTGMTMAFAVFGFGEFLCAFSARSEESLLRFGSHRFNYWLTAAVAAAGVLLLFSFVWSGWANMFGLTDLRADLKATVAIAALLPVVVLELIKLPAMLIKKRRSA